MCSCTSAENGVASSPLETAAEDYLGTVAVEDAIYRSADTGRFVDTPPP